VITASLVGFARSEAIVDGVYKRTDQAGSLDSGSLSRFLVTAADTRAHSPSLVARLVKDGDATLAKSERDFSDSRRVRILSHAMSQVVPVNRPAIYRLIKLCSKDATPMAGSSAEMYTALGRQELDRPGMLGKVSLQARKAAPYAPEDAAAANSPLPGTTIRVGYGPWLTALAQYGRARRLSEDDVAQFRVHLEDPSPHEIIVKAPVYWEGLRGGGPLLADWIASLSAKLRNDSDRRVREDMIAGELASMPRPRFLEAIHRLRGAQEMSTEPEIRYALGGTISNALY
jgi:hypothetical protein